jgi:hypothetical protein
MPTQERISHHLATARRLLDDVTVDDRADPQVKATAATAHATLVLAEQVAALRLVVAAEAVESGSVVSRRHVSRET